ncbi:hypothetical protein [Flexithrix dorotheae]|uniref:hypothetical protein n=1 Tax=Flexithrix dorotheae TaxID=70993 RepID=UPI0003636EC3|nr:hypothetical protein [Flexithrix dorotheae]
MNKNLFIVHTNLKVDFIQNLSPVTSFTNKISIKGLNFFISWDEIDVGKSQIDCDIIFIPMDFPLSEGFINALEKKHLIYILNDQHLANKLAIPVSSVKCKSIQVNLQEGLVTDLLLDLGDAFFQRNKNRYRSVFENLNQLFEIDVNKEAKLELMYLTNNLENIETLLANQLPTESLVQRKVSEISNQPLIVEALKMMRENYNNKDVFQKLRKEFHEIVFSNE